MTNQQPQTLTGVKISQAVFAGFEFIRASGATNMLDRSMVLALAREWGFDETADWIENADRKTYGDLIFKGPIVIDQEAE